MVVYATILKASRDEKMVDINQESQYYTLLQLMDKIPGKRPHVPLTGVDDPHLVQRSVRALKMKGKILEELAKELHHYLSFM